MDLFINEEKQGRHIVDSPHYIEGRSILTADANMLLRLYAGKGKQQKNDKGNFEGRETFMHTDEIGIWKDGEGSHSKTNRGTIHYSKTGAHIVPSKPNNVVI